MKRGDQTKVGHQFQGNEGLLIQVPSHQDDGFPRAVSPLAGHGIGLLLQFAVQNFVIRDSRPARHTYLQEHESSNILRVIFKEAIDGMEPVRNALGVVNPVDSDTEDFGSAPEFLPPLRHRRWLNAGGHLDSLLKVNTNGKWPDNRAMTAPAHKSVFAVDSGLNRAFNCLEEISAVVL